jgi:hypothetical protein
MKDKINELIEGISSTFSDENWNENIAYVDFDEGDEEYLNSEWESLKETLFPIIEQMENGNIDWDRVDQDDEWISEVWEGTDGWEMLSDLDMSGLNEYVEIIESWYNKYKIK